MSLDSQYSQSAAHRIQIAIQRFKRNLESDAMDLDFNITRPQMFLLYTINERGRCKLTQLAQLMEVKPSAITVMIDRMEKASYVKRTHDTEDRRSIHVEVTPEGKDVLKKAIQLRNNILESYLTRLNKDEVAQLVLLLEKLNGE